MYEVKSHKLGKWPFIWRVGHFLFSAKHFLSCFGKLDVRMLEDQNKCKGSRLSRGLKAFPFPVLYKRSHPHTARIFKWTLIEMRHQFRARKVNGHAKLYIGRDFQQFPASLFWEKWQKPPKMGFLAHFLKLYGLFWPSRLLSTSQDILKCLIHLQKSSIKAKRLKNFKLKNYCFDPK